MSVTLAPPDMPRRGRGRPPKYTFTPEYERWLISWLEQHLPRNGHERTAASLIPDRMIRNWYVGRHFYEDGEDLDRKPHITVGAFHRRMDHDTLWLRRVRQRAGDKLTVLVRPRMCLDLPYRLDELLDADQELLERLPAPGMKARTFHLSKSDYRRYLMCKAAWFDTRFDQWDERVSGGRRVIRWIARVALDGELRLKAP